MIQTQTVEVQEQIDEPPGGEGRQRLGVACLASKISFLSRCLNYTFAKKHRIKQSVVCVLVN